MQSIRPNFIAASNLYNKSKVVILGLPLDASASFREGAKHAPKAIRQFSRNLETYSPYLDEDIKDFNFFDRGDIEFTRSSFDENITEVGNIAKELIKDGKTILSLGGEHSVSWPLVDAYQKKYPDLALIQMDAHADLREQYAGNPFSHACVMNHITRLLTAKSCFQFGIRSGTRYEYAWMKKNHTLRNFQPAEFLKISKELKSRPVYLTIDIDVFDPSLVAGTGTPEAGGIFFSDFCQILPILQKMRIIGCDLVELAPKIDRSGVSTAVAAKITRELLIILNGTKN